MVIMYSNKAIIIILLCCAKNKGTSHEQSPWLCVTYFAHSKPYAQSTASIGGQEQFLALSAEVVATTPLGYW